MVRGEHQAGQRMSTRLREFMCHTTRYAFDGRMKLMADANISRSEVTRLLNGNCNPSFVVVVAVVDALEKDLNIKLDFREVFSLSGEFPSTVCSLVSCRGCPACKPYRSDMPISTSDKEEAVTALPTNQLTIPKEAHD